MAQEAQDFAVWSDCSVLGQYHPGNWTVPLQVIWDGSDVSDYLRFVDEVEGLQRLSGEMKYGLVRIQQFEVDNADAASFPLPIMSVKFAATKKSETVLTSL